MEPLLIGPEADCQAVLDVIDGDARAYLAKDFERMSHFYLREDRMVSFIQVAGTGLIRSYGWNDYSAMLRRNFRDADGESHASIERDHLQVIVDGDMAWAVFDQHIIGSVDEVAPPASSHEVRVFERHQRSWLIAIHAVFVPAADARSAPSIEVDEAARVLSMNPAAAAGLRDFPGLTVSAGILRATRPSWDKALRAAIRRAAELCLYSRINRELGRGQHVVFPVVLGDDEAGANIVCLVEVTDFSVWVSFGDSETLERRLNVAKAVYGLSEGQLALARLIVEGKDLNSAALVLGVTANTARTHLRRMFDKTGVHSQTALLRVILSLG